MKPTTRGAACRAIRLITMIHLMRERSWCVPELAERLGVSTRTVWRDLATLQDEPLRVPLVTDDGRWRIFSRRELGE